MIRLNKSQSIKIPAGEIRPFALPKEYQSANSFMEITGGVFPTTKAA